MIIRARYCLGGDFAPIDNGTVRVEDGRIVEVGAGLAADGGDELDFGDAIVLPGLVNAHTHLELGFCAGKLPPSPDFTNWLKILLGLIRRTAEDESVARESVRTGLAACLEAGTTLVGDITRQPQRTRAILDEQSFRPSVLSFGEVIAFGKMRVAAGAAIQAAIGNEADGDIASAAMGSVGAFTLVGVSPHAPYTVEPQLLETCVTEAGARRLPLCVHACESRDEAEYVLHGTGPLRDYLESLDLLDEATPAPGVRTLALLRQVGALRPGTVLAHCNYVTDAEIELLARTGTGVAYCPRTHDAFGHDPHPFRRMLEHGVNVCLGTDSLASNPSLSVLEEMRFLRGRHPELSPAAIVRMGTRAGADALGLGSITGTIAPGKRADLAVFTLDPRGASSPLESILTAETRCVATVVGGAVSRPRRCPG